MLKKLSAAGARAKNPGLFVVGTDTGVGKTYVAARIAAALFEAGVKVGVYKPVASGCGRVGEKLVSEDAAALWEAAGRPGELEKVCPQRFAAALAPHLAAKEEGKKVDARKLRTGIEYWRKRSEVVIVEGAGGLLSPLGEKESVADLAEEFGYPLIVVAPNRIGAINACLLTLTAAAARKKALSVAAVVLNDVMAQARQEPRPPGARQSINDPSMSSNLRELKKRCAPPVVALAYRGSSFETDVDWLRLARG